MVRQLIFMKIHAKNSGKCNFVVGGYTINAQVDRLQVKLHLTRLVRG